MMSEEDANFDAYQLDERCIVPWKDGSMYAGRIQKILDPLTESVIEGVSTRKNGKQRIIENTIPIEKIMKERSKRVPVAAINAALKSGERWFSVHYFGWGNNFDEWLPMSRMMPHTAKNVQDMKAINAQLKEQERLTKEEELKQAKMKKNRKRKDSSLEAETQTRSRQNSLEGSGSGQVSRRSRSSESSSSPRGSQVSAPSIPKRRRVVINDEPGYEVKLSLPLDFKRLLVADWRLVTRDREVVELPRSVSVVEILRDFSESRSAELDSGDIENMALFIKSMTKYFDYSLGMMLLFRFERNHYYAARRSMKPFRASLIYGAEHLARLVVNMPTLLSQMASMDDVTLNFIVDQLELLAQFMVEHRFRYFAGAASYASTTRAYELTSIPNVMGDSLSEQVNGTHPAADLVRHV